MHDARAGETERLAGEAFQACPQCQVLALDLLHRELPHRVLRGWKMPLRDTRLVRVVTCDVQGGEQGLKFQEHRILPRAYDVREHSARVMIKRMPEPPRGLCGADGTPYFIGLDCASYALTLRALGSR